LSIFLFIVLFLIAGGIIIGQIKRSEGLT